MLDECLMKRKFGYVYCIDYQAGTRKFTLAGESEMFFNSFLELELVWGG